jgi:hypothetical protein
MKICTIFNKHSQKVSYPSYVSLNEKDTIPESIHMVHLNSDIWKCDNCNMKDDVWFMKKHPCKHNKKREDGN